MKDGIFIFDNVIHMYDQSPDNLQPTRAAQTVNARWQAIVAPRPEAAYLAGGESTQIEFNHGWANSAITPEEAAHYLFTESDTDMAVAQTVPFYSYWKTGFSPAHLNYQLKELHPERVIFCGGVDPVWQEGGVKAALAEMERQVEEWGAKTFKFYNWQYDAGWSCDDREIAYPMYEKAQELGITHIQFHKGNPIGMENVEKLAPYDLQAPLRDFPDMQFVIHHLGDPYFEDTFNIAGRFDNCHLSISGFLVPYFPIAPDFALHRLGRAIQTVGPHKLLYGSEAFAWLDVQAIIDTFFEVQFPEEMQDRYGYPEITEDIRRMIMGGNQARLYGFDVDAKLKEIEKAKVAS